MKKFILVVVVLSILLGGSLFYVLTVDKVDISVNFEYIENGTIEVYYINDEGLKLVMMDKIVEDDDVYSIFNFLTCDKNQAPLNYYSYVPNSCKIISYSIDADNNLTLNLNKQIYYTNIGREKYVLGAIIETYKNYGFTSVIIKVEDNILKALNDFLLIDDYSYLIK